MVCCTKCYIKHHHWHCFYAWFLQSVCKISKTILCCTEAVLCKRDIVQCNTELPVRWLRIHLHVPLMCSLLSNISVVMSFRISVCIFYMMNWSFYVSDCSPTCFGSSLQLFECKYVYKAPLLENILCNLQCKCTICATFVHCTMQNAPHAPLLQCRMIADTYMESIPPTHV